MACWQLEGCFIMFCLCRYDKMSEGGTSGYGGAPGREKGIKVMIADSSFCIRMPSSPTKSLFFLPQLTLRESPKQIDKTSQVRKNRMVIQMVQLYILKFEILGLANLLLPCIFFFHYHYIFLPNVIISYSRIPKDHLQQKTTYQW